MSAQRSRSNLLRSPVFQYLAGITVAILAMASLPETLNFGFQLYIVPWNMPPLSACIVGPNLAVAVLASVMGWEVAPSYGVFVGAFTTAFFCFFLSSVALTAAILPFVPIM